MPEGRAAAEIVEEGGALRQGSFSVNAICQKGCEMVLGRVREAAGGRMIVPGGSRERLRRARGVND